MMVSSLLLPLIAASPTQASFAVCLPRIERRSTRRGNLRLTCR